MRKRGRKKKGTKKKGTFLFLKKGTFLFFNTNCFAGKNRNVPFFSVLLIVLVLLYPGLTAGNDVLSGKEIMESSFNRDDGRDAYFKIEMTLVDKSGSERKRSLEIYTRDYDNLIKTFIKFTAPADIAGTAFLSWENAPGEDTQYLYLPALGRPRRIVSSQKNLSFVNTDFTYEDMQRRNPDKDEHTFIREDYFDARPCYVIESKPKDNSQYSRRVSWVDKESRVIIRIDFYDKKGDILKVFKVTHLDKRDGIWTAVRTTMENLKEKHLTRMRVVEARYNQGLADEIFTLRNMEGQ